MNHLIEQQHRFFETGATWNLDYRIRQLRSLYQVILQYQERIFDALYQDLGKSEQEAYLTEIGMVLSEISYTLRHIRAWSRPDSGGFSIAAPFSVSRVLREPYGVVLILAPFNYPFQLALLPLVSALAAGNCAIIKPSELAPATAAVVSEMLNNNFEQRLCAVVTGGAQTAQTLVNSDFDYIFFTGSRSVGQTVYEAAAKKMIPVTLELGGKSPCIVEESADLDAAARRIVWGKFLNAGQTCVAPDYLLVQDCVKQKLIERMSAYIVQYYGENPEHNPQYPRIVNERHFQRLREMLEEGTILVGGQVDEQNLRIAPTILENVPYYSKLLSDEIFGPLLPVIEFSETDQVFTHLSLQKKPLALYLFTRDKTLERRVMQIPFGGGCVNDTILHMAAHGLPFGGVGDSGVGSYHGRAGFETFSHKKSIMRKLPMIDMALRYPPFDKVKPILKRIFR